MIPESSSDDSSSEDLPAHRNKKTDQYSGRHQRERQARDNSSDIDNHHAISRTVHLRPSDVMDFDPAKVNVSIFIK